MQLAASSLRSTLAKMGVARISHLRWTVPPAALAAYTAGEWNRRIPQGAPFTTTSASYKTNSESQGGSSRENRSPEQSDQDSVWFKLSQKLDNVKHTVGAGAWGDLGGNLTEYIVPDWARFLPATAQKLQRELSMAPGSLADEIWRESHDPDINPEILRDAEVRVSGDLCKEELEFRKNRQQRVRKALAFYLDIPEEDIHPDDVPVIAMCGSGGGLRALVAGTGSYLAAQEAGLWRVAGTLRRQVGQQHVGHHLRGGRTKPAHHRADCGVIGWLGADDAGPDIAPDSGEGRVDRRGVGHLVVVN